MKVILILFLFFSYLSLVVNTLNVKKININARLNKFTVVRDFSGVEKWLKPYINSKKSIR